MRTPIQVPRDVSAFDGDVITGMNQLTMMIRRCCCCCGGDSITEAVLLWLVVCLSVCVCVFAASDRRHDR